MDARPTQKRRRGGDRKTFRFCLNTSEHAQLVGLAYERGESVAYVLRDMIRRAWAARQTKETT